MKTPSWWRRIADAVFLQEDLNFLLTNRVPRRWLTLMMGRVSRIEHPWLARAGIALWRLFTDLDLSEAQPTEYRSLKACFTRSLKPGLRPQVLSDDVITSPCDAIVGACGRVGAVGDGQLLQAKGMPYRLDELLGSVPEAARWEGAHFVTLRLTSAMYHRFHAPHHGRLRQMRYISGDTWNVNPVALKRVQRLFARNERAVLNLTLHNGLPLTLVPVAAILVASIRVHALDVTLHLQWAGATEMRADHAFQKGDELGWFEHGSTIIVLAPAALQLAPGIETGARTQVGQALFVGATQAAEVASVGPDAHHETPAAANPGPTGAGLSSV
jgi:phosphatidylserine decarboxylase